MSFCLIKLIENDLHITLDSIGLKVLDKVLANQTYSLVKNRKHQKQVFYPIYQNLKNGEKLIFTSIIRNEYLLLMEESSDFQSIGSAKREMAVAELFPKAEFFKVNYNTTIDTYGFCKISKGALIRINFLFSDNEDFGKIQYGEPLEFEYRKVVKKEVYDISEGLVKLTLLVFNEEHSPEFGSLSKYPLTGYTAKRFIEVGWNI